MSGTKKSQDDAWPSESPNREFPAAIGPFRLIRVLGRGGMGTVYLAEQDEPVRRRVALKVINHGIESDFIMARFEAERQALALMNHPNIATVFDAGTTDKGRPYYVMELIEGEPFCDYCDSHRLTIAQRLNLFIQVCDGIQHAHQRLIIHRDIKPGNVLIQSEDGRPVPKIIDFGIAKSTGKQLVSNRHLETQAGSPIGTPIYMSPEQIEGSPADLDARVDVYTLGMFLYESLAGVLPLDPEKHEYHRLLITLLEEEIERPSARLAGLGEKAQTIAANRSTPLPALIKKIRGDLDWIVLKALDKDRRRRYDTVNELRNDIRRFLANEPVKARPPHLGYRARKFLRRNRLAVIAATAVLLALIGGITGTTIALIHARAAQVKAQQAQTKALAAVAYMRNVLASVDPNVDGRKVRALDLLDNASRRISSDLEGQAETEAMVRKTIGWVYLELGLFDEAERELKITTQLQLEILGGNDPETLQSQNALGRVYYKKGLYQEAERLHRLVFARETSIHGPEYPETLWTMYNLAKALHKQGLWDEAEKLYRANIAIRTRVSGPEHQHTLVSMNSLALLLCDRGNLAEAEELQRHTLEVLDRALGSDHPNSLQGLANLVEILNQRQQYALAQTLAERTLVDQNRIFGEIHPETLGTRAQLALSMSYLGQAQQAESLIRAVWQARIEGLGPQHPETLHTQALLAGNLLFQGRREEAREIIALLLQEAANSLSASHPRLVQYKALYGKALVQLDRPADAEPYLIESYKAVEHRPSLLQREILTSLITLYEKLGNNQRAQWYRDLLNY